MFSKFRWITFLKLLCGAVLLMGDTPKVNAAPVVYSSTEPTYLNGSTPQGSKFDQLEKSNVKPQQSCKTELHDNTLGREEAKLTVLGQFEKCTSQTGRSEQDESEYENPAASESDVPPSVNEIEQSSDNNHFSNSDEGTSLDAEPGKQNSTEINVNLSVPIGGNGGSPNQEQSEPDVPGAEQTPTAPDDESLPPQTVDKIPDPEPTEPSVPIDSGKIDQPEPPRLDRNGPQIRELRRQRRSRLKEGIQQRIHDQKSNQPESAEAPQFPTKHEYRFRKGGRTRFQKLQKGPSTQHLPPRIRVKPLKGRLQPSLKQPSVLKRYPSKTYRDHLPSRKTARPRIQNRLRKAPNIHAPKWHQSPRRLHRHPTIIRRTR
jgi:hypothetical protein